jgi:hypothetical protein
MWKNFFFASVLLLTTGCYSTKKFNIEEVNFLKKSEKIRTSDSCANFSYIAQISDKEYGNLFTEYIDMDSSCHWNGLQRGFFEDLFKSTMKFKSFKVVERIDYNNYEFTTYLIDEKYYINLIYRYTVFEDLFIIDYDGKYTTKLIKQFDGNYINLYLFEPRFEGYYSNSLVRMNILNSYFTRERESSFAE